MTRPVVVRFAPSPTGPLHIGGIKTALFNYLFAKKHGGKFILRIEDTDQERYVTSAEQYIINSLKWCGIIPDEGYGFPSTGSSVKFNPLYKQSERNKAGIYRPYIDKLLADGNAYLAFDTEAELEAMRERAKASKSIFSYNSIVRNSMRNSLTLSEDEVKKLIDFGAPYVIRIKIPRNEEVKFNDIIRGNIIVNTNTLDDKVLFKSDGIPTYHMANVVDDHLMDISHVIRGEEWLPSAPLHVLMYKFLGWEDTMPQFAHLPLILNPDGKGKLSKRNADKLGFPVFPMLWPVINDSNERMKYSLESNTYFKGFKEDGYFPEALVNFLARLGWNPDTAKEVMTIDEMISLFSFDRVSKNGARFDLDKLKWYNQQYLRMKSNKELANSFLSILEKMDFTDCLDINYIEKVCNLVKEKAYFINDFWNFGDFFFCAPQHDVKLDEISFTFFTNLRKAFYVDDNFTASNLKEIFGTVAKKQEIKPGTMMHTLRLLITGKEVGPPLFESMELLGKSLVINRLEKLPVIV